MSPGRCCAVVFLVLLAAFASADRGWSEPAREKVAKTETMLEPDAAPESVSPDPLAPAQVESPAPRAPGAPTETTAPAAGSETDPVVVAVRARLSGLSRRTPGEREDLAAATAYYADRQQPVWTNKDGLADRGRQAIEEIGKADDWGLKASAFELPPTLPTPPTPESLAETEATLALAVLKYARHARGGRVDPAGVSHKFDQKPTLFQPKSVLEGIAAAERSDTYLQGLHPKHVQFERLHKALIEARKAATEAGASGKPSAAIERLVVNMERWRWMPADLGPFYVWDSVPEQMTRVYDNGREVLAERIVVGKASSPTPIFSAQMQFIIFHPSWGVPSGIKSYELAPLLRNTGGGWFSSNPNASDVLRAQGLRVTHGGVPVDPDAIDWKAVDIQSFEFEQGPGPTNVLGAVKFRFPNNHDVYMHDTPERNLFGGQIRAFSHGCMRVQNPIHLAEVLLAHDKGWSTARVHEASTHGNEVTLSTPIPVHITYFTATVDEDGKVSTRPDIYALDSRTASALAGHAVEVAAVEPTAEPRREKKERAERSASAASAADDEAPRRGRHVRRWSSAAPEKPFNPFAGIFGPQ
jgi:L,D-transpeptidase YcbB